MNEPRKKWILVAEGEPHDEQLIVRSLGASHAPTEVVIVRDGSQALDCLYRRDGFEARQTGNPAVVLLDLQLPRVSGLEVLRQVKGDAQLSAIPVVVLASGDPSNIVRCYQLGANACIVKPLALRRYAAALEEVRTFWLLINEPPPQLKGVGTCDDPGTNDEERMTKEARTTNSERRRFLAVNFGFISSWVVP